MPAEPLTLESDAAVPTETFPQKLQKIGRQLASLLLLIGSRYRELGRLQTSEPPTKTYRRHRWKFELDGALPRLAGQLSHSVIHPHPPHHPPWSRNRDLWQF